MIVPGNDWLMRDFRMSLESPIELLVAANASITIGVFMWAGNPWAPTA